MIPDLDTYRSANELVKQYGQDAPITELSRPTRLPLWLRLRWAEKQGGARW